jgi:uncharacterized protein (TIRG00374 family)
MFVQGVRWWLLLRTFSDKFTFTRAIAYHFSSIFYSMILPTSAAQEVIRTLFVVQKVGSAVSWGAAWICKLTAILISLLFSLFGILYLSHTALPHGTLIGIIILFFLLIAAGFVSFSKNITAPFRKIATSFLPPGIVLKLENIREGIYQYRTKKKDLLITIVLTTFIQIVFVFNLALTIKGVSGSFFFWECLAFMPIIEMISMAQPFTPNGMGVREALTTIMFQHLGLSKEQLGIYIILTLSSTLLRLIGAGPIFYGMIKKQKASVS